jgi:hypothetical protein
LTLVGHLIWLNLSIRLCWVWLSLVSSFTTFYYKYYSITCLYDIISKPIDFGLPPQRPQSIKFEHWALSGVATPGKYFHYILVYILLH